METVKTEVNTNWIESIDWNSVEETIKGGTFKLANTAKAFGVPAPDLRQELINRYGNRLVFKRGKKGGVFFS